MGENGAGVGENGRERGWERENVRKTGQSGGTFGKMGLEWGERDGIGKKQEKKGLGGVKNWEKCGKTGLEWGKKGWDWGKMGEKGATVPHLAHRGCSGTSGCCQAGGCRSL